MTEIAYHWLRADMHAGSGNESPWTVGESRTYKGGLRLCAAGYHSSPSLWQAFKYIAGPVACIVEISGDILRDDDKQVARTRKLIKAVDTSAELRLFAADCASRALHAERKAGREPAKASWTAIKVARAFARGKATERQLIAAAGAADAAEVVAYAVVCAAAGAAVGAAASAALATLATGAAAYAAERTWQEKHFNKLVLSRLLS